MKILERPKVKQLLYCWASRQFNVLVPKRRGEGFIRAPYWQKYVAALSAIEAAAGCDIYGLDGALSFQCSGDVYHGGDDARNKFVAKVVPLLEAHYQLKAIEIHEADYWNLNPVAPQ